VIVDVSRRGVICALVLGRHVMTVDQGRVVVLVAVVMGSMLELAQRSTGVVMGNVIVVVAMGLGRVGVLLLASLTPNGPLLYVAGIHRPPPAFRLPAPRA
jgi:hypothetical protein